MSLGERLRAARDRFFVGRERELDAFRAVLRDGGVLGLHGPGGIGKSTLLRRLADEARDAGRTVSEVDGRTIEPSPAAFTAEVRRAGGSVLLVDAFEHCQGLEGWLRDVFLPRLPAGTTVVVAGREPCVAESRELGDLSPAEADRLLELRGVPAGSRPAVLSFTGGHPLALTLAATLPDGSLPGDAAPTVPPATAAPGGAPGTEPPAGVPGTAPTGGARGGTVPGGPPGGERSGRPWRPAPEVLASLLSALIGDVPSASHRRALEICAHAPHTTEALLADVLGRTGGVDPGALMRWLRGLPFTEDGRPGVTLHEMVREAVDADLRWRDPAEYERMHHAIGDHLLSRVRAAATPADSLAAARALAHLQRYGPAAEWLTLLPRHGHGYEDGLRPGDHDAITAMTRAAQGEEAAATVTFWLGAQPGSFRVYRRSTDDSAAGFLLWLRLPGDAPDAATLATADPLAAAALAHAERTRPLGAGEHVGMLRFMIDSTAYDEVTSAMHTLQLRVYALWITSGRLAWTYVPAAGAPKWERLLGLVGHHPAGVTTTAGGREYTLFACDWRVTPRDVWFALATPPVTPAPPVAPALSRPDFDAAVRDALRDFHRPAALATSPLLGTRMTVAASRSAESGGAGDLVDALREVLTDAVDTLRDDPREARLHRVVATAFFHRLPTQVAAAERLGLSFSTYRRHLQRGLDLVCGHLWQHESTIP
ncbi:hypothetical protein JCM9534A_71620 [Catenuloplanes indicus JCM 9534]